MKNKINFIIPSSMNNKADVVRVMQSVDKTPEIIVYFINQSDKGVFLNEYYKVKKCKIYEIRTNGVIPLSLARNMALSKIYEKGLDNIENSLTMFIDDDAWFPGETIKYLLNCDVRGYVLSTKDPVNNKSFKKNMLKIGKVKGYHVCCDIISICMVIPTYYLVENKIFFNEKLGLGAPVSQGEESLFIYLLHRKGLEIIYDNHEIYHPYKKTFHVKNFYSLAYFWAFASKYISPLFWLPSIKMQIKYSATLAFMIKEKRYYNIFIAIWKGYFDGKRDTKNVLGGIVL